MQLSTDTQLGAYRIDSLLGRGGMGEVYLAQDTRLNRPVAIKVLPESFATNPDRVARFEREARLLATLSHQNIAGIYGLEEADGLRYLALELVNGRTLKEHLEQGAIPIEESLRIGRQIADAVAAAHEQGVIHRDLKPGNIMITADDTVKVLDFGVAKALDPTGTATSLAQGPTLSAGGQTAAGAMIGTPTYMSPEQARGKTLDKRSDIWSFGCVLYECLTGHTPFGAETATDTFARILEREADYTILPKATPLTVHTLLRRCLQKDRKKRLQDIGDARVQIDEAIADPSGTTLGLTGTYIAEPGDERRTLWPWLITALFAAVGVAGWIRPAAREQPVSVNTGVRMSLISPNIEISWSDLDLAPNGSACVFRGRDKDLGDGEPPPWQLYSRRFDSFETKPVPGTTGARAPVYSPSGDWVVFHSRDPATERRLLKRVRLDDSPAITVCDVTDLNIDHAIWLTEDKLLISEGGPGSTNKFTVAIDSGDTQAVPLTYDGDDAGSLVAIGINSVLPGGERALGVVVKLFGTQIRADTILVSLQDWTWHKLLDNAAEPVYSGSGQILFLRDRALLAAPFDAGTNEINGRVVPLLSGVSMFDISDAGTLIYHPTAGSHSERRLMVAQPGSKPTPLSPLRRAFQMHCAISPDGRWLGTSTWDQQILPRVWVFELASGAIRPLTPENEVNFSPVFAHDGQRVAYFHWDSQSPTLNVAAIDGTGEHTAVVKMNADAGWYSPECWTPDDRAVLATLFKNAPVRVVRIDLESGAVEPLLSSTARSRRASFSPDGKWLLYHSNETGEFHVHLRPYDVDTGNLGPSKVVTTTTGTSRAAWASQGDAIYFIDKHDNLQRVAFNDGEQLTLSEPSTVLDVEALRVADNAIFPLPGDERFVYIEMGSNEQEAEHLNVILNWLDELNRKVQPVASR